MAPPTGIRLLRLLLQEYGLLLQEYGSSYRNMGFCYRNMAPPTGIWAPATGIWAPATGIRFFLHKYVVTVQLLSHVWLCDSVDYSMPGSMGFSRQGYWSRLPFPSPRIFSDQGLNTSPSLAGGFFTTEPPGNSYRNRALLVAQGSALALLTGLPFH